MSFLSNLNCLPGSKFCHFLIKFLGQQDLMRQTSKHEIKIVRNFTIFEAFRLIVIVEMSVLSHSITFRATFTFDKLFHIFSRSAFSVVDRFSNGVVPTKSRMTINKSVFSLLLSDDIII